MFSESIYKSPIIGSTTTIHKEDGRTRYPLDSLSDFIH